jgi:hypothetical protein
MQEYDEKYTFWDKTGFQPPGRVGKDELDEQVAANEEDRSNFPSSGPLGSRADCNPSRLTALILLA